jgi:DNA-binding MarR family transcriptional regulator
VAAELEVAGQAKQPAGQTGPQPDSVPLSPKVVVEGDEHDEGYEEECGSTEKYRRRVDIDWLRKFRRLVGHARIVRRGWYFGGLLASLSDVTVDESTAQLASTLRPSLLKLTRIVRNQRVNLAVTLTQLSALGTLRKLGPLSAGELAMCERVQPPSMTKVLSSLEELKLITRTVHPTDRRQAVITLTDSGRELLESESKSREAWLSKQLEKLSVEERALLSRVVPVLDKLAEL